MGREIRKVPAGWQHPKYSKDQIRHTWQKDAFHPMYDRDYDTACADWYAEAAKFTPNEYAKWFHDYYGSPPDKEYYREQSWAEEEATHFVVYETVSEGTPVTPIFEKPEDLVAYLVENGDFWDQERGDGGWDREAAEKFVGCGFAFSMAIKDGNVSSPRDAEMYN